MTGTAPPSDRKPTGARAALAAAVAEQVDRVPGVRRTSSANVPIGTQHPGGTIVGVRVAETVEVHIVAESLPLEKLVAQVRQAAQAAVRAADDSRPVVVAVDDLDVTALPRLRRR